MKMHRILPVLTACIFFFSSCNSQPGEKQNADTTIHEITAEPDIPGNFTEASGIRFDSNAIQKFLREKPLFKEFSKEFDTFYRRNNYLYVWFDKNGLVETSGALISALANIEQEGVKANIPYKDSLDELMLNSGSTATTAPDINSELMLTGEYFYYAKKIWAGELNNKATSIDWYLPRKKPSYAALLADNLSTGNMIELQGNVAKRQYEGLKKALTNYRDIDKNGGEIVVPSVTKPGVIKPNVSSPVVPLIRRRLMQLGDISEADTSNVYDSKLIDAVNRVKGRYGLKPDSIITNAMIREINVPAKKRAEQIMVNMERLRWLSPDTSSSGEFIFVNIPEYTLHYFENRKEVWNCNVVVGKPVTKTVIFSGKMQYVVFSPYWNVPPSIINKEIKPGMRRNPNYLAAHNMEWNGGRVRQKPGPRNSLGLVKFLFPNSNNIYLHDTPSKSLFEKEDRAFSHGCIRVAKPRDLAIRILRDYPEWTPEKIDAAMHAGKEKTVTLKKTIPVYIGYFTAFIDSKGQVNFRSDVYQRDDRLLQMLIAD